jgi:drug/metabolite transporter (DMT)-like permease
MKASVFAGVLGAVGSSIGKLAFDGNSSAVELTTSWCASKVQDGSLNQETCSRFIFIFRSLLAICMVMINGVMLGVYVRAMQKEGSLPATVTNFGASFVASGLIGYFIFSEPLNIYWCCGANLISIGIYLVAYAAPSALPPSDNQEVDAKETAKKNK